MKIAQLAEPVQEPTVSVVKPLVPAVAAAVEEEEMVMKHELTPESNAKLKRQLKIIKTADPALYDKIVNFR